MRICTTAQKLLLCLYQSQNSRPPSHILYFYMSPHSFQQSSFAVSLHSFFFTLKRQQANHYYIVIIFNMDWIHSTNSPWSVFKYSIQSTTHIKTSAEVFIYKLANFDVRNVINFKNKFIILFEIKLPTRLMSIIHHI